MTTPATRSREESRDRVFDSAGVAIRFLEAGRGDPVLLLHSFTGSVERATLGGAPGRLHWSDDDDRRVDVEAAEIERGVLRAQILRLWPRALSPPSEDEIRARSVAYLRGNDRQALAAMRRANRDQRVRYADVAASGVPIPGLVGSNDGYLGEFRELALHVPQLELVVLEDAAHGEAARQPRFTDALFDFLARHPG